MSNLQSRSVISLGSSTKDLEKILREYPSANQETNKKLFEEFQNGSLTARDELILRNIRLVLSSIRRISIKPNSMEFSDLVNEGIGGLINAIEFYNPEKGAFSTYATHSIERAIIRSYQSTDNEIRIPEGLQRTINKYRQIISNCEKAGTPIPSDGELKSILNITDEVLDRCKNIYKLNPVSLNTKIGDDKESELADFVEVEFSDYEDLLDDTVDKELIAYLKSTLSRRDYYILYYRIISDKPKKFEELSMELNITKQRVKQILDGILLKLKEDMSLDGQNRTIAAIRKNRDIDSIKKAPISIDSYCIYLLLRDILNEKEKQYYKLTYLSDYVYDGFYYVRFLNSDSDELAEIKKSIDAKIDKYIKSENYLYRDIREKIISKYGYKLFDIDLDREDMGFAFVNLKAFNMLQNSSYEEIQQYLEERGVELEPNVQKLLRRYFGVPKMDHLYTPYVDRDINAVLFGYKRNTLPFGKIYETYITHEAEFTEEQKKLMKLYSSIVLLGREKKYPNYTYSFIMSFIEKLEKMYFGYTDYSTLNFSKDRYLKIRELCLQKIPENKIRILDRVYIDGASLKEISLELGISYLEAHTLLRQARENAISIELSKSRSKKVDPTIYIDILEDPCFVAKQENKEIALMFYKEGKSYDEIAKKYSISKAKVSNTITNLIWNMDFYRFGFVQKRKYDQTIIEDVIKQYNAIEQYIIREVLKGKGYSSLVDEKHDQVMIKNLMKQFYNRCYQKSVESVNVTKEDIVSEVLVHPSISILRPEERQYFALRYGIKCEYNQEGYVYSIDGRMANMGLKYYQMNKIVKSATDSIAAKKLGLVRHSLDCIPREDLEIILKDKNVPITDKERHIICSYYEICGTPRMSLQELCKYYSEREDSIKRRILRALVNIKKYMNGEIEKGISYEKDIKPYIKYFSLSDRKILSMQYKDGMSLYQIAKELSLSNDQIYSISIRMESFLSLLKEGKTVGIDFDYYYKMVDKDDFPFYGDKALAKKIFDLYYEKRMSIPKIIEELKLPFKRTSVCRILDNLVLASFKRKEGIKKCREFTYEEIRAYFLANCENMSVDRKRFYLRYFERVKNETVPYHAVSVVSPQITLEMLKAYNKKYFELGKSSREEALSILKKHAGEIDKYSINALRSIYNIRGSEIMSGADKMKLIRALAQAETKAKIKKPNILKNRPLKK